MLLASFVAASAINVAVLGQNDNYCHLPWDKQCFPIPGCNYSVSPGTLTICNNKSAGASFHWAMDPDGSSGLSFAPSMGDVYVAPGECVDVPFLVLCTPMTPGGFIIYDVEVVKDVQPAEPPFGCNGSVINHSSWAIDPVGPPVIIVPIPDQGANPVPVGVDWC
ncbi:MAG: hypothetical protein H6813_03630 [Phycisphaeraceae bacterium]|nr:hypothetical protein [Phycisphaeraceae bacterium]MCB9847038.1 hypothetical protein [Phycisphaeraceae bacterium]